MVLVDIVDNVARRFIPFLPFLLSKNSLMLAQHIIAIACFLRVSEFIHRIKHVYSVAVCFLSVCAACVHKLCWS
jgi:hypothetical protein